MFYSHQLLARKAPLGQIWYVTLQSTCYSIQFKHNLQLMYVDIHSTIREIMSVLLCIHAFIHNCFEYVWNDFHFVIIVSNMCGMILVLLCTHLIRRAATLHAKINRRNLNKLNIINICEEILNPSVPMALRLSGILMGGVVIVYERKVKLLYEDVTRLLVRSQIPYFMVEINEAWRVKAKRDPTVLPKGKSQAKYEDVTLPANQPADLGDLEQHLQFFNSDTLMGMHKSAYIDMVS
ncbi:putative rad21/Rec8-like protein [Helianthus annuus]|nr:putative rad21/Rec8-like protein [Helianthus annuus]KAJ0901264.1 putative rad21/Rec8-like protein [Helianthus annuus]